VDLQREILRGEAEHRGGFPAGACLPPPKPEAIERQAHGIVAWNGTRTKRLGDIKVRCLVLVGKDDILTPPAFAIAEGIRNARLAILPGGHGFFLEEVEAFNRAVIRFLKSVRSK
jgi:pimeloyl-ACP methyl ester carboxylesterase